jgi:hypothetical protein
LNLTTPYPIASSICSARGSRRTATRPNSRSDRPRRDRRCGRLVALGWLARYGWSLRYPCSDACDIRKDADDFLHGGRGVCCFLLAGLLAVARDLPRCLDALVGAYRGNQGDALDRGRWTNRVGAPACSRLLGRFIQASDFRRPGRRASCRPRRFSKVSAMKEFPTPTRS